MKIILIILSLFIGSIQAGDEKIETLTIGKKTYTNVTITKKNPDSISIVHDSGSARINYKILPAEIIKIVGSFDPKIADEYATKSANLQKQHDDSVDAELKTQKTSSNSETTTSDSRLEYLRVRERTLIDQMKRRASSLGNLGDKGSEAKKNQKLEDSRLKSELNRVQLEIIKITKND